MTALDVRGLEKSFGGLRVTAGVSLTVEAGERRLIIGPNGAGKTTVFNLVTGVYDFEGSIRFGKHNLAKKKPSQQKFLKGWLNRVNTFPDL
jgi:ABC-type branched-subunit amino acid transport system ATPase component